MDVHKDPVRVAVLEGFATEPERVERLPNDLPKLRRPLGLRGVSLAHGPQSQPARWPRWADRENRVLGRLSPRRRSPSLLPGHRHHRCRGRCLPTL